MDPLSFLSINLERVDSLNDNLIREQTLLQQRPICHCVDSGCSPRRQASVWQSIKWARVSIQRGSCPVYTQHPGLVALLYKDLVRIAYWITSLVPAAYCSSAAVGSNINYFSNHHHQGASETVLSGLDNAPGASHSQRGRVCALDEYHEASHYRITDGLMACQNGHVCADKRRAGDNRYT